MKPTKVVLASPAALRRSKAWDFRNDRIECSRPAHGSLAGGIKSKIE
jgi:hypothetical protein